MIAIWMLYVSALSLCLGLAALALERAARLWARPRRFVWAVAIAASLLVPLAGLMIPVAPVPQRVGAGSARIGDLVVRAVPAGSAPSVGVSNAQRRIGPLIAALSRPLLLLWGGASLALALGLLRAGFGLRRRARGWRATVLDGTEVLVAPDIGPAVVRLGGLRIVLPEWALSAEPAARSLMLLHESEHCRARDPDLLLGGTVALMLVPWALPLWWQVRRLQLAVETDCDWRVMCGGADAHAYGALLLRVGARAARQPLLAPTAFSERRSLLERRIEAMTSPTSKWRFARTVLATGVSVVSVAAACVTPRPAAARQVHATAENADPARAEQQRRAFCADENHGGHPCRGEEPEGHVHDRTPMAAVPGVRRRHQAHDEDRIADHEQAGDRQVQEVLPQYRRRPSARRDADAQRDVGKARRAGHDRGEHPSSDIRHDKPPAPKRASQGKFEF